MKALVGFFILFLTVHLHAQVNGYARVTAISSTTLTIGTSNETYGTFTTGMPIIIMQMQDNVIGSNTSNNSTFGTLSSVQSTGQYEIAHVTSVTRSGGTLSQITIGGSLANTYNTGSNSMVQVITYPLLGASFTTTSDISAIAWNGSIGGVVAFRVTGTLTLNHNITADNAGFRGGTVNSGNAGSCDNGTYITSANDANANKGEGIYRVSSTSYAAGRGRILNGGGGGNSHNGGGGGGSNASSGGEGGRGYGCITSAGGLGGATLYSLISTNRIFMGGGGGAGEANNSYNTAGGNGGGIVIISANQVITSGSGAALRISANGQTAADVGNDGAGAGGAGGSVMLSVNSWSIAATKTLTISANGGNGGNVTDATAHGGGGGGGQGAVLFSTSTPSTNITTQTLNGNGGRNYAGGTYADNGGGSSNTGIFNGSFALLPVRVLLFKGKRNHDRNELTWRVMHAGDVEFFEMQRSANGNVFNTITRINTKSELYIYTDQNNSNSEEYYRIAMHYKNGVVEYTGVVVLKANNFASAMIVEVLPNPVVNNAALKINVKLPSLGTIKIISATGTVQRSQRVNLSAGENIIPVNAIDLSNGIYQVNVHACNESTTVKMMVRR